LKTKFSPVKHTAVPRLDHMEATMVVKVLNIVTKNLKGVIEVKERILYADSTVVLYWNTQDPRKQPPFVANHLAYVQEGTGSIIWTHCETKGNPADLITHKCRVHELMSHVLWWSGLPIRN
jgi:hypothetical protein